MNMRQLPEFSSDEYVELLQKLDGKHSIFYHLWDMGVPEFTDTLTQTAGVCFNETGDCIRFIINYDFWQQQTDVQKLFVICHECIHVMLDHGKRFFSDKTANDFMLRNQVADIVTNHFIVNKLGFDRKEIDPDNVYCWVDSFFDENTSDRHSVEWYYQKLKNKNDDESSGESGGELVDDHSMFDGGGANDKGHDFSSVIKDLNEKLTLEEKEFIKEALDLDDVLDNPKGGAAGQNTGGIWKFANTTTPVQKKKKWESVIKKWALKYMKDSYKEETQWARLNRRFATISGDLLIPSDMEIDERETEEERIQVWFFQDTSGSCSGYIDRFFSAARSLPEEKFDVKMHCFDTRVFETTLESGKLFGFGGTSFSCIERYIQSYIRKNDCEYPKAVFVITDGYGDYVAPEVSKVWNWFLTPHGADWCIPPESHIFDLKDYE